MKKRNTIIIIAIFTVVMLANSFVFYQSKHTYYKYYWNKLLNRSQTFSLDQEFILETGVIAKLENTDYSCMFVDHFPTNNHISQGIDQPWYYVDDYKKYTNGNLITNYDKTKNLYNCEVIDFNLQNKNGERRFIFHKTK